MNQRNLRALIERLLVLPALVLCIGSPAAFAATIGDLGGTYHVSGSGDDATGDGSEANPWRTISHAFEEVGAYGPVIEVGEGDYDAAAGESFPINIDSAGTHGFTLRGPGDPVAGGIVIYVPGAYDDGNMLEAMVPLNGPVLIENLNFAGVFSSSGSPLGDTAAFGDGHILDLNDDGEGSLVLPANVTQLEVRNNNAHNIGLVDAHWMQHGAVSIHDNGVINAESAVHVFMKTSVETDTFIGDEPAPLSFSANVYGNQVSSCSTGIGFDVDVLTSVPTSFQVSAQNNTIRNCEEGLNYETEFTAANGQLDAEVAFIGNVIENCGWGIVIEASGQNIWTQWPEPAPDQSVVNRDITISGNTIDAGMDGSGLAGNWSGCIRSSADFQKRVDIFEDVVIAENTLVGGAYGIISDFGAYNEYMTQVRNLSVVDNDVSGASTGVCLEMWADDHEDEAISNYDLLIHGNNIHHNVMTGVRLSQYLTYTRTSTHRETITQNHIHDNGKGLRKIYDSLNYNQLDATLLVRGNVIARNGSVPELLGGGTSDSCGFASQIEITREYAAWGDYATSFDLEADLGSYGAMGYNTIVPLGGDPLCASSVGFYVRSTTDYPYPWVEPVSVDLKAVGNWWGTQDASAIEDRVFHGADDSSICAVDLSNPLPDSLDFTAEYQDGVGLVVTAGADAGFVAYAGDLIMEGSITGPGGYSDGGEIQGSWVSEDYQTLVLPIDIFEEAPGGDFEICFMNPGGQTGCASFTIGDEDCSQNQAPVAVSDNAETDQGVAIVIDLTGNDSDYTDNMDPTAVTITQGPDKGTVVNNGDGTATYTPDPDEEYTTDTFNYTVSDTCGAISNIASCQIFIGHGGGGGGNQHDPGAVYDSAVTEMGAAVTIDILSNDFDPDGDALDTGSVVITQDPAKGSVVVNADGTVTYTPNEGIAGTTDTFNYTVDDEFGGTSNIATVAVSIQYATDGTDITGGVGGNAGGRTTQGARGGVGAGGTPTYGGTRTP